MAAQRKTIVMDHDDLIASLIEVRDRTDRENLVSAFVVGLRNRRLDLRSPLGSYAFHLNHPLHKLDPFDPSAGTANYLACNGCGYFSNQGRREMKIDFDHYDSLRRTSTVTENIQGPDYAFADLTLFSDVQVPRPEDDDWERIRQLLKRVRHLSSDARLTELNKALIGLFPGDKYARQQVLEILGFCGVLQPKNRPLVTDRFFYYDDDQFHPHFHTRDWAYPVSWWTGADGVNDAGVAVWFPEHVR